MRGLLLSLLLGAVLCSGCTTTTSSNTKRAATEQLLISNAVDDSLSSVDFSAFDGHSVFVEEKYIDAVDQKYIIASIRHRLMMQGVRLVDKKEDSDICMEVRSGGVGTDAGDMFLGIPEITVPGMVTIPKLPVVTKEMQQATAKLGIVAYHTQSGQILGSGGVSLAQSDRNNWFVFGVGPYQNGTLKQDIADSKVQASRAPDVEVPKRVAFQPHAPPRPAGYPTSGEETGRVRLTGEDRAQQ